MLRIYQTGDIITSTASSNPLLLHKAVCIIEGGKVLLAHNTPMKTNQFGGNVVVDTLEEFLADGRKILDITPSCLERHEIDNGLEKLKYMQFNSFDFNCEHFVSFLVECRHNSPQLRQWLTLSCCAMAGWMMLS